MHHLPWLRVGDIHHPLLKTVRRLQSSQGRSQAELYVVEGIDLVSRAIEYGAPIEAIVVSDSAHYPPLQGLQRKVPLYVASQGLIAHATGHKPVPDALALIRSELRPLPALLGSSDLVQLVECPSNPDNLGMLLRSAEAAGVGGLAIVGEGADPFQRRCVRASRGAVFRVPVGLHADPLEALSLCRDAGHQVVASSARSGEPYTEIDLTRPTVLLVGNEHTGLPEALCRAADRVARIPMAGRISSLNLAVATSLLLYEALRQRAWSASISAGGPV